MNVLITGGAGFIGSHLASYHLSMNDKVMVVDNLFTSNKSNLLGHLKDPNFSFYQHDLLTWEHLPELMQNCDVVYNLAAIVGMFNVIEHPILTFHTNSGIVEKLLSIGATLKRKPLFVIASSSEVYGSKSTLMKETDQLRIDSSTKAHASYPISKLCNEVCAMAYYKEKKIPVIVIRIFNTVGIGQSAHYGMVLPRFIAQACNQEPLTVFSDGSQTRSFCDVRDLCNILYKLVHTPAGIGQIINVGSDKSISILDLAKKVIELTGSTSAIRFQNYKDVYGDGYIEIKHRKPHLVKMKKLSGYQPQWPLSETIKEIYIHLNGTQE